MKSTALVILKISLVVLMSLVEPLANFTHHHLHQDHTHQEETVEIHTDKKRQTLILK